MILFIVVLRIALSAVFAVAGVTKLLDLKGTREAAINFGAPEAIVPALSIVLPILELLVAAGLLLNASASVSAAGALALLGLFIIAISINLTRGQTHDCHCFGQLYSRPLGWPTLARNVAFVVVAALILWQTMDGRLDEILPTLLGLPADQRLMLLGAVIVTALVLISLQRRARKQDAERAAHERSHSEHPQGLALNTIAPPFEITAYHGGTRTLSDLLHPGKPLLLIFTSPSCGPCVALFQEIKEWQQAHSDHLTIALISKGTIKDNFVNVARNSLGQVLLQQEREVAEKYQARVTPTAVLVNTDGRIGSELAAGAEQIRHLLHNVVGYSEHGLVKSSRSESSN